MVEVSTGAATGAARVTMQILATHRRPVLEIYLDLDNWFRPVHRSHERTVAGGIKIPAREHRNQETELHCWLRNVGAVRAENVRLILTGDLPNSPGPRKVSTKGWAKGKVLPQLAPGQSFYLFGLDVFDLQTRDERGRVKGWVEDQLAIEMRYNGPNEGLNRFARWFHMLRRGYQYSAVFKFDPSIYDGADLPPPRYE